MAFSLYQYTPSVTAPIVLVALFAVTTGLHAFQLFRTRTWFFAAFLCGGFCESQQRHRYGVGRRLIMQR